MSDDFSNLMVTTGAQGIIFDLANGCTVSRSGRGAPAIALSRLDGPLLRSRGPVDDVFIQELLNKGLAHLLGETPPQPCKLTPMGEAYYERFLKSTVHRSVNGFLPHRLNQQILELIAEALPGWSFDVNVEALTVHILLTRDGRSEELELYPPAYINDPDPAARLQPTLAAVAEGIMKFKQERGT